MHYYSQQPSPERCIYVMQATRFKVFESQDLENGRFDVTFEIEGKKLYAHQFALTSVSEYFNAWLSNRWTAKDKVIKIDNYSYKDFYQFLRFLYTGECKLTEENVFAFTDMAEFYGVQYLKGFCDEFLSVKTNLYKVENVEEMFEFADIYSLSNFRDSIKNFISNHRDNVYSSVKFIGFKKQFIEYLSTLCEVYAQEKFFENLYKWAENRVMKKKAADDTNFNLLTAIKAELKTFLPRINFSYMKIKFLSDFVVEKGFILSPTSLSKIFELNENSFKNVVELAEKQALKKQEIKNVDKQNFNLVESIKADLAGVLPKVAFYKMDKSFLTDFVVPKGIISETQASHVYDTRVKVENNGKVVTGLFKDDDIGILCSFEKNDRKCKIKRQSTVKIRFPHFQYPIPSTPSTVMKMKGTEWYLCLEADQTLAFKHYLVVENTDYLLAEMKSRNDFQLTPGELTNLTVCHNNI